MHRDISLQTVILLAEYFWTWLYFTVWITIWSLFLLFNVKWWVFLMTCGHPYRWNCKPILCMGVWWFIVCPTCLYRHPAAISEALVFLFFIFNLFYLLLSHTRNASYLQAYDHKDKWIAISFRNETCGMLRLLIWPMGFFRQFNFISQIKYEKMKKITWQKALDCIPLA